MIKRIAALSLVTLLIFALCGPSTYARTLSGDEVKPAEKTIPEDGAKKQVNEKLRTEMLKLVEDAKAGRVAPAPRPQIQPQTSNNLSKGTKVAIGVAIAVAVIGIIVWKVDKAPSGSIPVF